MGSAATNQEPHGDGQPPRRCGARDPVHPIHGNAEEQTADPDTHDEATSTVVRNLIGDERQYTPQYQRMVSTLSEGIAADHDDPTLIGYTHPLDPGVVARASSGDDIPTSVGNGVSHADFEGAFGWRTSLEKEIRRVESFSA